MHYLKDKKKRISFTKKEVLITLVIHILLVAGTLYEFQPLTGFLDGGAYVRGSWADYLGNPPYGRAERSTIDGLSRRIGLNGEQARVNFVENNILFEDEDTLQDIAEKNNIVPEAVYKIMLIDNKIK